jgi:hypothetical protein
MHNFSQAWNIDPKDKTHTHKNKHIRVQTPMWNMFVIVKILYGTQVTGKGKENDRASTMS